MAAPLCVGGETIGILDAESRRPGAFQESDLDLFQIFANQAATAIRNTGLVSQLEQRSRQLEKSVNDLALLNRVAQQMNSNLSLESLLQEILYLAHKALNFDHCAVLLKQEIDGQEFLVVKAALGYRDEVGAGMRLKLDQGITGAVFKAGKPLLVRMSP